MMSVPVDASAGADATVRAVVRYAADVRFAALPADAVHACQRRLADTLACGIAGGDAGPSRIARALALRTEAGEGARVLGTGRRALPELAAFANAAMARYLDGNDCFPGGGGHPSGVIAPVLAAAQVAGADGRDVIAAIVVGYEVHRAMHESLRLMTRGLDHAFYPAVAAAAATAKILRLDAAQMANAISLAVTPNLPLAVTRRGQLSMWKGVAEANGVRNGVFAALLAQAGMTGPERPFDGALGLRDLAGPVDVACLGRAPLAIMAADMKFFVTEYHSQGPLAAALAPGDARDRRSQPALHRRGLADRRRLQRRDLRAGALFRSTHSRARRQDHRRRGSRVHAGLSGQIPLPRRDQPARRHDARRRPRGPARAPRRPADRRGGRDEIHRTRRPPDRPASAGAGLGADRAFRALRPHRRSIRCLGGGARRLADLRGWSFKPMLTFLTPAISFPSLAHALIAPALFVGSTTLGRHVATPNIVGRRLTLNPHGVFPSLAFWTWLWRPIGAFLSVPFLIFGLICSSSTRRSYRNESGTFRCAGALAWALAGACNGDHQRYSGDRRGYSARRAGIARRSCAARRTGQRAPEREWR